jgi:hypothetical protein
MEHIEPEGIVRSSTEMAVNAISHILRRVQLDSDFAWHMLGTEALSLCLDAYAVMKGKDRDDLKAKIIAAAQQQLQKTMPRIKELEVMRDALIAQVQLLQETVDDAHDLDSMDDDDDEIEKESGRPYRFYSPAGMPDLLQYCRLRNERPTVEAIEAALNGFGLGECLRHMESAVS